MAPRPFTPPPQVTFDVDANSILTVRAEDKGSGKREEVKITPDTGRLSKEEVQRMLDEADAFAAQDKVVKETIVAKNALEALGYHATSQAQDEAVKKRLSAENLGALAAVGTEVAAWMETHPAATQAEYATKRAEMEERLRQFLPKDTSLPKHDDL